MGSSSRLSRKQKEILRWLYQAHGIDLSRKIRSADAYFNLHTFIDDLFGRHQGVAWGCRKLLGRDPKGHEMAIISRALKRLEERGLVRCTAARAREGARRRTTRVSLTQAGVWEVIDFLDLVEIDEWAQRELDEEYTISTYQPESNERSGAWPEVEEAEDENAFDALDKIVLVMSEP